MCRFCVQDSAKIIPIRLKRPDRIPKGVGHFANAEVDATMPAWDVMRGDDGRETHDC